MGFSFGGTRFKVGVVDVGINSIDTEKMVANIEVSFPLGKGKMSFRFYTNIDWNNERNISLTTKWEEEKPKEPEPENDDEDTGDNEYGQDDDA